MKQKATNKQTKHTDTSMVVTEEKGDGKRMKRVNSVKYTVTSLGAVSTQCNIQIHRTVHLKHDATKKCYPNKCHLKK